MSLDFPSPATTGQIFSNWQFDGVKWKQLGSLPPLPITDTGRNLVTNGTFVVQQRGAGPWTTGYTADRWLFGPSGDASTAQISPLSDANRTSIGNETATSCLFFTVNGSATPGNYTQAGQYIEGVRRLGAKTVTVSFWAAAGASGFQVGVRLSQSFGTGGSPSATVSTAPQTIALTTSPARYSLTFAIPSTAGKTLGTNNDDSTGLWFGLSSGSTNSAMFGVGVQTGNLWFWGVQVEFGTQATALDAGGTPQQILAECMRFFEVLPQQIKGSTTQYISIVVWAFKVRKRATPTINYLTRFGSTLDFISTDDATAYNATPNTNADFDTGCTASADL